MPEPGPSTAPAAVASASGLSASFTQSDSTPVPFTVPSQYGAGKKAARPDFAPSNHGTLRSINTREMLDVRQQAEFFMALGQHDEAMRLLESNIRGSDDSNPLVFLDLLKIFHTLGRRADFERYREDFNQQFTGRIPPYEDFLAEGNGLEAYDEICQQIVVLWPTAYTIDYIEQCLVRVPEDDPEQGIDLEAFKDLLLLYGILKRLDQFYDSSLAPFSASRPPSSQYGAGETRPDDPTLASIPQRRESRTRSAESPVMDIELDSIPDPVGNSTHANLIDFDVTDYTTPQPGKSAK